MGLAHSPSIISDGLIFYLDAANLRSYSGSGLTVNGLVGGIGGTLINGVGFTSANNGSFTFDGTNDQILLNSVILSGSQDFTISAWVESTGGTGTIFANYSAGNLQMLYSPTYVGFWLDNNSAYASSANYKAGPVNFTIQRSGGSNLFVYLNGILIKTGSSNASIGSTSNFRIGASSFGNELFQGKIYNIQVYNKALSATEILQNYNATRKRFEL
jgi:hypothetical protein